MKTINLSKMELKPKSLLPMVCPFKMEKKCSNCFKIKPVTEFYRKLDRWQSRCKACNAEVVYGYNYRAKLRLRDQLNLKMRLTLSEE
jgi:hypothetical protein